MIHRYHPARLRDPVHETSSVPQVSSCRFHALKMHLNLRVHHMEINYGYFSFFIVVLSYLVSWMAVAEFFKDPVGPTLKSSIDTTMVAFALGTWSYVYWHFS